MRGKAKTVNKTYASIKTPYAVRGRKIHFRKDEKKEEQPGFIGITSGSPEGKRTANGEILIKKRGNENPLAIERSRFWCKEAWEARDDP